MVKIIFHLNDVIINVSQLILMWLPWLTCSNDVFFLQFLFIYVLILIFTTSSLFYTVFYLMLEIVYFGIFLALYQLELFSAFLWLAESVVIFICLLLLFYITVYDAINTTNLNIFTKKNFILFFFILFFVLNINFISESEFYLPVFFNNTVLWDDFYEALSNDKMNDLYGLMLSFYVFNSFEFLMIGFLLLIGSIICVNLNKFLKSSKTLKYPNLFNIFETFASAIKMLFMRKQNLVNQEIHPSSTRVFKKK